MHWEEIDTLLEYFVSHFSDRQQWSSLDIGCGNGRLLRHIVTGDMKEIFLEH
jgi:16S rRNA G1207 methylase RsmC